jgi:hypothetical protein
MLLLDISKQKETPLLDMHVMPSLNGSRPGYILWFIIPEEFFENRR